MCATVSPAGMSWCAAPESRIPDPESRPWLPADRSFRIFPLMRTFLSVNPVTPSITSSLATLSNAQSVTRMSRIGVCAYPRSSSAYWLLPLVTLRTSISRTAGGNFPASPSS